MTLSGEIQKLRENLTSSYTACEEKGATIPVDQNFDNLAECISTIEGESVTVDSALSTTSENPVQNKVITGALNEKQLTSNLVTSVSSSSTDTQYPSAKCVYDIAGDIESALDEIIIGGSGVGIKREVSANGVYQPPASSFSFSLPSNATDLGAYAMPYAFYRCKSLTSVDLSSLTTVSGDQAMIYTFYDCTNLASVDLSSLTTLSSNQAMHYTFFGCTGLTSVDLSNLTTVSGTYAMSNTFSGCTSLTSADLSSLTTLSNNYAISTAFYDCTNLTSVDLSGLTTVSGRAAMDFAFYGCTGLTSVDLSSLTTLNGRDAIKHAFVNCTSLTSLSFPALTSTSFGSYTNQFSEMLNGVTGCTVHFPSNLESVIGSWSSVTAGFGGTNTTVLFDLPATT